MGALRGSSVGPLNPAPQAVAGVRSGDVPELDEACAVTGVSAAEPRATSARSPSRTDREPVSRMGGLLPAVGNIGLCTMHDSRRLLRTRRDRRNRIRRFATVGLILLEELDVADSP
jgi:hypothetical protein